MLLESIALAAGLSGAAGTCQVKSPAHTVALVELYTSQGCSSCPPADRWLSTFNARVDNERAVPLALHVGYWDYIGWKDPFARREFNDRQRFLADLNRNRTVYTPGVFVHGRETPRWSDRAGLDTALRTINAKPAAASIELAAAPADAGRVDVEARASVGPGHKAQDVRLFVALTQNGIVTNVKAGENRGETLANDHVTRDWSGALPLAAGRISLAAADAKRESLALVAFVQNQSTGDVLQAVRLPLAACGR